jgi:hypothetical protein
MRKRSELKPDNFNVQLRRGSFEATTTWRVAAGLTVRVRTRAPKRVPDEVVVS